jgi:CheY-like chemotaxis protein
MGRSGTGLGMAVVWGAVRDHNGYIEVQSKPGKGSRIVIYLPSTAEQPKLLNDESLSVENLKGNNELVLIVDDMKEQREMTVEIVKSLGYRSVSVPSGEAAIDYLKNNNADVMLLDIIMAPGINGVDAYKDAVQYKPDIKTIIVSGFSNPNIAHELKKLGISDFLQKPYTIESLARTLKAKLHTEGNRSP